jgi:membrane complex biogenesis BtpA family protein
MSRRFYGLIGVVHLPPLPGDPAWKGSSLEEVLQAAERDALSLAEGGASAILVENFGSVPFVKGTPDDPSPPATVAQMAIAVARCMAASGLPTGVNVLRNDAIAALGVAAATNASFIRVNVLSGAVVTDQGLIEGQAAALLRERKRLGALGIEIAADVRVKHARPLVDRPLDAEVADLVHRAGADALIVTGEATGAAIDVDVLRRVRAAAPHTPVWLGSGVTPEIASSLRGLIDGAIVGTWLKRGGDVRAPVDPDRVRQVVQALEKQP